MCPWVDKSQNKSRPEAKRALTFQKKGRLKILNRNTRRDLTVQDVYLTTNTLPTRLLRELRKKASWMRHSAWSRTLEPLPYDQYISLPDEPTQKLHLDEP
eukprot:GHVT01034718.1.p2 GENE.GHVT01034718.1~~GHVT01034718.1.p2  ORF type:complete len:100 (-),score=1.99 GHVT01034718.1:569-868(-)